MSDTFKLVVIWTAWTPRVATRIVRDLMSLQRIAKQTKTTLVVASDEALYPQLNVLGLQNSNNFLDAELVRVYVAEGNSVDSDTEGRIPESPAVDTILISPEGTIPGLAVDKDYYSGIKFYKDWQTIPETMPLSKRAPVGNSEPTFSPFL